MRRAGVGLVVFACALLAFPLASPGQNRDDNIPWTGTWSRSEDGVSGNLILVQSGNKVTGRYTWNDGSGHVAGVVDGETLGGTFDETHYKGGFHATLSLGWHKFTGG